MGYFILLLEYKCVGMGIMVSWDPGSFSDSAIACSMIQGAGFLGYRSGARQLRGFMES